MIAIDTSSLIAFLRGDRSLLAAVNRAEHLVLPSFVVAEYLVGVLRGERGERQRAVYEKLIVHPGVSVLFPDAETTLEYARLRLNLLRSGTPIGSNDIWIAALCLQHDLALLTRDQDFQRMQGLKLVHLQDEASPYPPA